MHCIARDDLHRRHIGGNDKTDTDAKASLALHLAFPEGLLFGDKAVKRCDQLTAAGRNALSKVRRGLHPHVK